MATFTVTTGDDVVDANDGVLSLREAVIETERSAGYDTIVFHRDVGNVTIKERLGYTTLDPNNRLTIDGGFGRDGQEDVSLKFDDSSF